MLRDSETDERIPLKLPGKTLVGRAKACDIIPSSTSVSKRHAEIEVILDSDSDSMKEIWVEDLGSRNGTFTGTPDNWKIINEKRRRIKVGDFVKFGLSATYYRLERLENEVDTRQEVSTVEAQFKELEPQSLEVRQHSQPPSSYDIELEHPPPFNEYDDRMMYSNVDDEHHETDTYRKDVPTASYNLQNKTNDNKIHVSIEYPDMLRDCKPPVSILIGGDEGGGGKAHGNSTKNWNDLISNTSAGNKSLAVNYVMLIVMID